MNDIKDTEKGREEMCEVIEEYANERALESAVEATIDTCIEHGDTKEETFVYGNLKLSQMAH